MTESILKPDTPHFGEGDINPTKLESLIRQYAADRFVPLAGYIGRDEAAALLETTRHAPAIRVECGVDNVAWDEQKFDPGHPAYEFFLQPEQIDLVKALTGLNGLYGLVSWTSCYKAPEYINPHCDAVGSIQLLVCLQAPRSPQNGGVLVVGGQELFLTPGTAVAFEATSLEHYTTPLVATDDEPDPRRVVLIGRYFLE